MNQWTIAMILNAMMWVWAKGCPKPEDQTDHCFDYFVCEEMVRTGSRGPVGGWSKGALTLTSSQTYCGLKASSAKDSGNSEDSGCSDWCGERIPEWLDFVLVLATNQAIAYLRTRHWNMRLDHPDYIKLLRAAYEQKRRQNQLSLLLAQPTPANIRRECVNVCKEGLAKKDEAVLRAFFGPASDQRRFLELIENFATDKFKPLDNYLKGVTATTDDRNLELLAWLIDFPHRPYVYGKEVLLSKEEKAMLGNPIQESENTVRVNQPFTQYNGSGKKKKRRMAALLVIALLIGFSGYQIMVQQFGWSSTLNYGNAIESCMYWNGEQYVRVSCDDTTMGRLLLPLRIEQVKDFKRITREDTITKRSIGVVHYLKRNGTPEFYTREGYHPIEHTRKLRPLSKYMYEKYLGKNSVASQ